MLLINKISFFPLHGFLVFLLVSLSPSLAMQDENNENEQNTAHVSQRSEEKPSLFSLSKEKGQEFAEELLEKAYLVHIAPINPFDNDLVLQPGSAIAVYKRDQEGTHLSEYLPNPSSFRPCLFFSIHGVLKDRKPIFFSNREYAALIPFKKLSSRIVNLYPSTTAVWGPVNLKEQEGCIVFTPADKLGDNLKKVGEWGKASIQSYQGRVVDAVETFLEENSGGLTQFQNATEETEFFYDTATLAGVDLNNPELFTSFLAHHPYISFGQEAESLKAGVMHLLTYLYNFNDGFLRLWGLGIYEQFPMNEGNHIKKYKVDSLIILAEHALQGVEEILTQNGLEEMLKDFAENQKPKIQRAIENIKNYLNKNKNTPAYKERTIDFSEICRVMSHSPYKWVEDVLKNEVFSETRESFEVVYWFQRYINHQAFKQIKIDEYDELEMIIKGVRHLENKYKSGKYNLNYVLFCHEITSFLKSIIQPENKMAHIEIALNAVIPIFPRSGVLRLKTGNSQLEIYNIKEILKERGIGLDSALWKRGTNRKLPTFISKSNLLN